LTKPAESHKSFLSGLGFGADPKHPGRRKAGTAARLGFIKHCDASVALSKTPSNPQPDDAGAYDRHDR
jgi:hypothetical protein